LLLLSRSICHECLLQPRDVSWPAVGPFSAGFLPFPALFDPRVTVQLLLRLQLAVSFPFLFFLVLFFFMLFVGVFSHHLNPSPWVHFFAALFSLGLRRCSFEKTFSTDLSFPDVCSLAHARMVSLSTWCESRRYAIRPPGNFFLFFLFFPVFSRCGWWFQLWGSCNDRRARGPSSFLACRLC